MGPNRGGFESVRSTFPSAATRSWARAVVAWKIKGSSRRLGDVQDVQAIGLCQLGTLDVEDLLEEGWGTGKFLFPATLAEMKMEEPRQSDNLPGSLGLGASALCLSMRFAAT